MNVNELLDQNREADLLRFSTAGSVDDGKSTLIGRLLHDCKCIYDDHLAAVTRDSKKLNRDEVDLALLTDGLQAEREQGITIDVAYRYFSTPKRRFVIADTPGHEQYTRNMVTGASSANLAIVLIDARNGVLTQSKRHGFISALLGIPHIVVAINKMDLVDYSQKRYEQICAEYADFVAKLNIKELTYIPISALKGDNVVERSGRMAWYKGCTLLNHLESVQVASDRNLIDFRFPVQVVNRPNQDFRGFSGTVASGVVRVGSEIMVLPSGKKSRVSAIASFDGNLEYAFPPQSVTVCLEDEIDVSRGDMLVHPGNVPHVARSVEAMLVWMDEKAMSLNTPYYIKHTTNLVRGAFTRLHYRIDPNELHRQDADRLELNDIARVSLELFRPIVCDEYQKNRNTGNFIVIDPTTNATVAAGMVIERSGHRPGGGGDRPVSRNITRESSLVTPEIRQTFFQQKPATLWLTGLSGSGKSTIAKALEKRLMDARQACFVLDGDNVRHGLNRDLGFAAEERKENIRRISEVASLFNQAGMLVITAFISPYREDREAARKVIGPERFLEIFVAPPLGVCEERDPKGLYKKARNGEIGEFTGISAPYEEPSEPDLVLPTHELSVDQAVDQIMAVLEGRKIIGT